MILASLTALAAGSDMRITTRYDDVTTPRRASLVVGLGGSWLFGGNGDGYGGGLAERVALDLALGEVSAFNLELEHARHVVADAGAYFPEQDVPVDAVSGFRDYVVVDASFRLGFDFRDETRFRQGKVTAVPYMRLGAALAFTNTRVEMPSLDGRFTLRSIDASPALSLGAGAEIRVKRWISVLPHLKAQPLLRSDAPEVDGTTRWGFEWRVQPAVDVAFNF